MTNRLGERIWTACLSALQLDRLLVGELGLAEAAQVRAHLAGCAKCSAAADGLRAAQEATRLPPLKLVSLAPLPPALPRPRRVRWERLAAAVAGLAAAASLLFLVRPAGERSKGQGPGSPELSMYVQHGAEVRRAAPGEVVAAGDAVRFAVSSQATAYVAVLSVDPRGRGSVYYPLGARAEHVPAGADVPLPLSTRLDGTLGEESILGLFCQTPVELEPVRARLESGTYSIPDGCQVTRWSFVKR